MSPYQHVDEARVTVLKRELAGDVSACVRFIREFAGAWDARVARLTAAVDRGDDAEANAVLLSLSSSSTMLGATTLVSTAKELRSELRERHRIEHSDVLRLVTVGSAAREELLVIAERMEPRVVA